MITFMSEIICITNRKLCKDDFFLQLEKIAAAHPDSIVLREKDLDENEYYTLSKKVRDLCYSKNTEFTMHYYYKAAINLGVRRIHLPLHTLMEMNNEEKKFFRVIGVSCHSTEEAESAEKLGATYITAGHIYNTDCKAGLPGRGLGFLNEIRKKVGLSVYGIGGISVENAKDVIISGADGICIMSGFMKSPDPCRLVSLLREVTQNNG